MRVFRHGMQGLTRVGRVRRINLIGSTARRENGVGRRVVMDRIARQSDPMTQRVDDWRDDDQLRAMSPFGQLTVFHLVPRSTLQLLDRDRSNGEGAACC
ncbi:hypothetical protein QZM18_07180 [Burkholderia diffusa]|uniref:hypothetical protein n=1 Tax=Burkholderia diffusa TaxID=488732 RepID=UPI0026539D08|nr:hypothetical protein [Burkholderia diffusa]MDN7903911.1 hypothetical protein [Burkholderia diffusa]